MHTPCVSHLSYLWPPDEQSTFEWFVSCSETFNKIQNQLLVSRDTQIIMVNTVLEPLLFVNKSVRKKSQLKT